MTNSATQIAAHLAAEQAELLDVVNENDEVIGQHTRGGFYKSDLKKQGGLLRFTHIFLQNDVGEVLIQQRSATKSNHPNLLDLSAAGHIGAGDDYHTAAQREMQEEIGIQTDLTPLFKRRVPNGFVQLFVGQHNGPLTLDSTEVKGAHWHTPTDLNTLFKIAPHLFSPALQGSWPRYYHYLHTGNLPEDNVL